MICFMNDEYNLTMQLVMTSNGLL